MNVVRISRTFPPIVDGTSIHMYELSKYQEKILDLHIIVPEREMIPKDFSSVHTITIDENKIFLDKFEKLKFHLKIFLNKRELLKSADIVHVVGDLHDVIFLVLFKPFYNYKIILSMHGGTTDRKLYKFLGTIFYSFVNKIYMTSKSVSNQLNFVDNKKKFITTSGVKYFDIPKKNIDEFSKNKSRFKIVTVGRLHEVKAYDDLILAMSYLPDSFSLNIIGDGPEYSALHKIIIDLKLENRVCLLGKKERKEIYTILRQSDLFVMTSVKLRGQEEGTPTAMMEAMSAGLPIITTITGGVKELLIDYPTICFVKQRDPKELSNSIKVLSQDTVLQKNLHLKSLQISENKDWSIIAKNITQLFENVLSCNE